MDNAQPTSGMRWLLAMVIAIGVLKVLIYNLALPLYNNIDEHFHADLIDQFARGCWPHDLRTPVDLQFAARMTAYETPEYLHEPRFYKAVGITEPIFHWEAARRDPAIQARLEHWANVINHEGHSPPVYYALAGLWTAVGQRLWPWSEARSLYLPRLLNVPLYIAFLMGVYQLGRMAAPRQTHLAVAAVVLVAMMPLQVFYGINSDVLMPPLFTWAMIAMLGFHRAENPTIVQATLSGLLTAAAFLTKYSAVPITFLLGLVLLMNLRRQPRPWAAMITAAICAAIPVALVLLRNRYYLGDWTGTSQKMAILGWSGRTAEQWLKIHEHPIWRPWGHWFFIRHFTSFLWRGELFWHGRPLVFRWQEAGLILAPLVLWFAAALPGGMRMTLKDGWALWGALIGSMLTLVWLSLAIDYSHSNVSAPDHPFLPNGRLVCGCLAAGAILLVQGLGRMLTALMPGVTVLHAMLVIAPLMLGAEVWLMTPVFSSMWNFFGIP